MKRAGESPTRPGRRADAWRRPVVDWVLALLKGPAWPPPGMRHAAIRARIVVEVRRALDPERTWARLAPEFGGITHVTAAGRLRSVLDRRQLPWRSAFEAESVMGVVERVLDIHLKSSRPGRGVGEVDPDDAARIVAAARVLAAIAWERGGRKAAGARRDDRDAALERARAALDLPVGDLPTTVGRRSIDCSACWSSTTTSATPSCGTRCWPWSARRSTTS